MRSLITLVFSLLAIKVTAQHINKQEYIRLTYIPGEKQVERAIEKIVANNVILTKADVEYWAGQTVELLPGFQVDRGAVFSAEVQKTITQNNILTNEGNIRLSAFPNPFDESTTIEFELPETVAVDLFVVNEKGQIIARLLENTIRAAGRHQLKWKADAFSSGIYIPILRSVRHTVSSRMIKK